MPTGNITGLNFSRILAMRESEHRHHDEWEDRLKRGKDNGKHKKLHPPEKE